MTDTRSPSRPLLSIITVCLNEPKLERTCESIVNQTFQNFEWLVIDGGSNDATLAVFERYKSRMDYFVSEPDGGIYFGMNKGMERATGEWLNFMNAGDMFAETVTLHKVFGTKEYLQDAPDILFGFVHIEGRGIPSFNKNFTKLNYYYNQPNNHQASFYKSDLFMKYGPYDTSYKILADKKHNILFFESGCKFVCLDRVIAVNDGSGISMQHTSSLKIDERNRIFNECFSMEEQKKLKMKQAGIHTQFARDKARELAQRPS